MEEAANLGVGADGGEGSFAGAVTGGAHRGDGRAGASRVGHGLKP